MKFQMVYIRKPPPHINMQPKYDGPALVLNVSGKVLLVRYLTGDTTPFRVNLERVKPVHKLRDE